MQIIFETFMCTNSHVRFRKRRSVEGALDERRPVGQPKLERLYSSQPAAEGSKDRSLFYQHFLFINLLIYFYYVTFY